jgi:magnesium transporter
MKSATTPHRVLLRKRHRAPAGTEPGFLGPRPRSQSTGLRVVAYGPSEAKSVDNPTVSDIARLREAFPVTWIDVQGLGNTALLSEIGESLDLHPLALEDVVNAEQRSKTEDYDDHLFLVMHRPAPDQAGLAEQVSLFLGNGFVVTLRDSQDDPFSPVQQRLLDGRSRLRSLGADYLAYCLVDAVVDQYMPLLDDYAARLDVLEFEAVAHASRDTVLRLHDISHELLMLRHTLSPLADALRGLTSLREELISAETKLYLRDCLDHSTRLSEELRTYHDLTRGLVELCLSSLSASTNDVMRVLTMIATIFIPLSFIASLYGMNFDTTASPWNMPELKWYLGYPFALLFMALTALGLMTFFIRKGWFRRRRRRP